MDGTLSDDRALDFSADIGLTGPTPYALHTRTDSLCASQFPDKSDGLGKRSMFRILIRILLHVLKENQRSSTSEWIWLIPTLQV